MFASCIYDYDESSRVGGISFSASTFKWLNIFVLSFFFNLLTVPNRLNSFTSMLLIARYRHSCSSSYASWLNTHTGT